MNTELMIIVRDFCEHALISLNKDYHNYFIYTKGEKSEILKHFNDYDLDRIIEKIICDLFLNGKVTLFFNLYNGKLLLSESDTDKGKNVLIKKIKWDNRIISNCRRKKIIKRLKKLRFPSADIDYNDKNYSRNLMYINELINDEVINLTYDFVYLTNNEKKYTNIYSIYSIIRMRKKQALLVNYVVNQFSDSLQKALNLADNDNIIFNGLTIETLDKLENQLLTGNVTLKEITNNLFNRINISN